MLVSFLRRPCPGGDGSRALAPQTPSRSCFREPGSLQLRSNFRGLGTLTTWGLLRRQARDSLRRQGRLTKEPPGITGVCCCTRLFMWVLGSELTKQWLYGLSHIPALPRFCYFHGIMVVHLSSKHPGGRSSRLATSSRVHTLSPPPGLLALCPPHTPLQSKTVSK